MTGQFLPFRSFSFFPVPFLFCPKIPTDGGLQPVVSLESGRAAWDCPFLGGGLSHDAALAARRLAKRTASVLLSLRQLLHGAAFRGLLPNHPG
jgi:hypothetical protein